MDAASHWTRQGDGRGQPRNGRGCPTLTGRGTPQPVWASAAFAACFASIQRFRPSTILRVISARCSGVTSAQRVFAAAEAPSRRSAGDRFADRARPPSRPRLARGIGFRFTCVPRFCRRQAPACFNFQMLHCPAARWTSRGNGRSYPMDDGRAGVMPPATRSQRRSPRRCPLPKIHVSGCGTGGAVASPPGLLFDPDPLGHDAVAQSDDLVAVNQILVL